MKIITELMKKMREDEFIGFEDYKLVFEAWEENPDDFTFDGRQGDYRVIADEVINEKLKEHFLQDLYILGCFNAGFLEEITDIPTSLIEIIQKANAYQELGEYIANNCDMEKFTETAVSWDGYGNFLNPYDGTDEEIKANGAWYHVFRQN